MCLKQNQIIIILYQESTKMQESQKPNHSVLDQSKREKGCCRIQNNLIMSILERMCTNVN